MNALPFSLIVITDWSLGERVLLERLEAALGAAPGRVAVQHRHQVATDRQRYEEGLLVAELCTAHHSPLFVNGRVDLALALDAHLHCTSTSLRPADVRPLIPGKWISTVIHHETDLTDGADLALVSPVFPAGSKVDDSRRPLGASGFQHLAARLPCPAFALGGITATTSRGLGARGAAVISAVLRAEDPARATRALLAELTS